MELTATVRRASLRKVNVVSVKKTTTLMAQHVKVSYVYKPLSMHKKCTKQSVHHGIGIM